MNKEKLAQLSMMMISHVGVAKSEAMQAIFASKESKFEEANKHIEEALKELNEGQKYHFEALQYDAEKGLEMNVLFIHAEDQMLTTQMTIDLAKEFIDVYKRIENK